MNYDLIYLWAVGKRRWDWYAACLHLSKTQGTIVVNKKVIDPSYNYYLTSSIDYLKQVEEGLPFPKTSVIFSEKAVDNIINEYKYPVILKTSEGRQGRGVFKVEDESELREKVKRILKKSPSVIIREYIPNDGDIRVFTVGYKAIGAMKRTPTTEGEFRSNISVGGKGEKYELESYPDIRDLAEKASLITKTEIAGVDIMINKDSGKPFILEVNPGPQFTGLEKYTGVNAALEIIKYFEMLYNNRK